jgi:uncharacterized protein YjbJ (UPF0337 family)
MIWRNAKVIAHRLDATQIRNSISFNLNLFAGISLTIKLKGMVMNKNQVNGTVKDIAGKVQEEVGKLVGSNEQQAKGLGKQLSGKVEKVYGDAKQAVKDATRV